LFSKDIDEAMVYRDKNQARNKINNCSNHEGLFLASIDSRDHPRLAD